MHNFDLGEPITSEESGDDEELVDDDEEEEEEERILLRKVMQQHSEHRGPAGSSETLASGGGAVPSALPLSGLSGKPRESLASRYYRNRNLTWTRETADQPTDSSETKGSKKPTFHRWLPNGSNGRGRNAPVPILPVREGYLCHICGEKGHHIRNCPSGSDPKRPKKVKPATGLPRSWLRRIPHEEVARVECDVYSLPDGSFAVLKDSVVCSTVPLERKIADRFGTTSASVISDHLRCPLCTHLFQEAVLMPCCGSSYCRSCVTPKLSDSKTCPACGETVDLNDIVSNQALQESVDAILCTGGRSEPMTNGSAVCERIVHDSEAQSVPPGTIREVKSVLGVIPLGGRVVSSQLRTKRPLDSKAAVPGGDGKRLTTNQHTHLRAAAPA